MANKKLKIGVLLGGKSTEHEASLQTAQFVIGMLDKNKYIVTKHKIPKNGKFNFNEIKKYDVVFPVLHGQFGEDGTVQGLLKLAGIPFVGASVLGSAVGMDKDVMKRLLRDAGIPVGKFVTFTQENIHTFVDVKNKLGLPIFIKPANAGSSVGISKIKNINEYKKAVIGAFKYDTKVIAEEAIEAREIECGVLGNTDPVASVPGEIIPKHEFYDYEAKYIDVDGATVEIPANISKEKAKEIRELAVKTFKVLACEGMGRVDFFLKKNGEVLVNEINTIPGPVMFRKLWEASGMPYSKVLDILVNLAIERFRKEQKLKTNF